MIKIIQVVKKPPSKTIGFDIVFISKNVNNVVKVFVQCVHQIMLLYIILLII